MIDQIRDVVGDVDGVNDLFSTPTTYVPGTLRVWENGRLLQAELGNGFDEGVPPSFSMKIAPRVGTYLRCAYDEV